MEKPPEKSKPPRLKPATINTLTLLMTLVLCALVYVFIDARSQSAPPVVQIQTQPISTPTPTPTPTAAPTARPGISKAVMLERLYESGLFLVGTKDEAVYAISVSEEDPADMLTLSLQDGYVRGFTLTIDGPVAPDISKDPGEIEKALMTDYAVYLLYESTRLRYMLPKLLDALSPDGYFPPSTALKWAELAASARINEKSVEDEAGNCTFVCTYSYLGWLTLAVGA